MPLIENFSHRLLSELDKQSDILTGIPGQARERWFYGMISRTLSRIVASHDAILTEISLPKSDGIGRVDFIFTYRRWIYVLEFKVGFASFKSEITRNNRITKAWTNNKNNGVVDQLEQIRTNCESIKIIKYIFDCADISYRKSANGIRFLPAVVFGHQITTNQSEEHILAEVNDVSDEEFLLRHNTIKDLYHGCIFSLYKRDFYYVNNTRYQNRWRATLGYSLYAGYNDFRQIIF